MKNNFALAFNEVIEDKGLPKEIIMEAVEAAMVSAYRRSVNATNAQHVEAKIDIDTGDVIIHAEKEVVASVQDERTEVNLADALLVDPETEIGSMVIVETTPDYFGRVAAQTARQVIQQRIREAEREAQYKYFINQVGEIVNGVVHTVNYQSVTLGLEMKAEGIMPRNQQIPREHFRIHNRVRALLAEVKLSPRGPQIILSRAHRDFLRRLIENEVPEIYHGLVEIRSISREPGQRSKVAVAALQPGVDPVGACVGIRGVRIQAIVRELNDEKIDVIEWNPDAAQYISKALSPARVTSVFLDEKVDGPKTATVVVPEDQLSLAIGRDGQNARLAAKLTSWRIDIKSLPEATNDVLYKLQNDPEYKAQEIEEREVINQVEISILKRTEGRPITPEEYHVMAKMVDRVEKAVIISRHERKRIMDEKLKIAKKNIPDDAFELPLEVLGLTDRVAKLLKSNKYDSVGSILLQMAIDVNEISGLSGFGPKAMTELEQARELLLASTVIKEKAKPEVDSAVTDSEEEKIGEDIQETDQPVDEVESISDVGEAAEISEKTDAPLEDAILDGEQKVESESKEKVLETDEELPETLEEIFKLKPEILDVPFEDLEDEQDLEKLDESTATKKKAKKKKTAQKRFVDIEYDPDMDVTIFKKKRKGDEEEWEEDWDI